MENDPFQHALVESMQTAAPEFVGSLREKLGLIKERYPHKESTVDSCLRGLDAGPTLGHILVAAYVLNGGVSLKFRLGSEHDADRDVQDFESLLQEIEGKIAGADLIEDQHSLAASAAGTPHGPESPKADGAGHAIRVYEPTENHPLEAQGTRTFTLQ